MHALGLPSTNCFLTKSTIVQVGNVISPKLGTIILVVFDFQGVVYLHYICQHKWLIVMVNVKCR